MMEQRSEEWILSRKGKMTASEIYFLLANHKEQMSEEELAEFKAANPKSRVTTKEVPFSEGTFTYLNKKVAECYMPNSSFLEYNEMKQIRNKAVEWGTYWEADARRMYAEAMGYEVYEVGFLPLDGYENFCGGSPDGIVRYENGITEIKCPFSPEVHQDYLLFDKPEDLKEYNLQYYAQMQLNMIVSNCGFGDFVSYDPRTSRSKQLKVLRVPKDEDMCKMLLERVELAKRYYQERMELIENTPTIIK